LDSKSTFQTSDQSHLKRERAFDLAAEEKTKIIQIISSSFQNDIRLHQRSKKITGAGISHQNI
jgi:hypothetical protein